MAENPSEDEELEALIAQARTPTGLEAAAAAAELFEHRFRLPFPPVPRNLVDGLRVLGPGLFGTRTGAADPWDLDAYLGELHAGEVVDYLVFGQGGHGVASWAMHYYLVQGPLALFVQIAWGGAYADDEAAASEIRVAFDHCAELLASEGLVRLPPGRRLVAVQSDVHGRRLGWLDSAGHGELEPHPRPLQEALALIEPRRG